MANTFSQIYIQTVFAVENRLSLITPEFKEDLYKYITGIVRNQGQKLISINGMPDHVHILIGLKPAMALADLVREINEYLTLLRKFDIAFDDKYVFEFIE
ncbi:MAG: transposase [Pyrinomonadaceae bacterium]|nr:transposase [Pyrinomonadaceae bacterium]